jgi:hypothetical protein
VTVRSVLAILDRPYRGGVEIQYADCLYVARELNRQVVRLTLQLRGPAVTLAVPAEEHCPGLWLGAVRVDTMPDHRQSLRELIADGVTVTAEEADLCLQGIDPHRLLPGIRSVDGAAAAAGWPDYQEVWFL